MPAGSRQGARVALAAFGLLASAAALAQTAPEGGISAGLDFSETYGFESNRDLDPDESNASLTSRTRLDFWALSRTRLSTLRFGAGTELRAGETAGDTGFVDPSSSLSYSRQTPDSAFSAGITYDKVDLDFFDPLTEDEILDDTLTANRGDRERTSITTAFETGRRAPLGFGLNFSYDTENFDDTVDPDLFDNETIGTGGRVTLRFSPLTTVAASLSHDRYEAEDFEGTERKTTSANISLDRSLSPLTSLSASVGVTDIDEDFTATGGGDDESGISGSLALTHSLPLGTIGLSFDTSVNSTGQRSSVRASRSFERRLDSLDVSLGLTDGDSGELETVANVAYARQLPRGELSLSLSRAVTTTDDDEDLRTTRAGLGYILSINRLSRVSFQADFVDIADAGAGSGQDEQRGNLSARWSREVNRDWDLSLGYAYEYQDDETTGTADSHGVFLTFERRFTFLP